jgi:hypothetical protein
MLPEEMEKALHRTGKRINAQIGESTHPLNILIMKFSEMFIAHYYDLVEALRVDKIGEFKRRKNYTEITGIGAANCGFYQPKDLNTYSETTAVAIKNLQCFFKLMLSSALLYYRPVIPNMLINELREQLITQLSEIVLRFDVYNIIFALFKIENIAQEFCLTEKLKEFSAVTPEELGVSKYFCLNPSSGLLEIFEKQLLEYKPPEFISTQNCKFGYLLIVFLVGIQGSDEEEEEKYNINETIYGDNSKLVAEDSIKNEQPSMIELMSRLTTSPYEEAVDKLRTLQKIESPTDKLKCVSSLNGIICESVDNFWKGINLDSDDLYIDADQFMSIFVFILIKVHMSDLFTHLNMINEFTTISARSNLNGYSLATLQACLYHILNLERASLFQKQSMHIPSNFFPQASLAQPKALDFDLMDELFQEDLEKRKSV